MRAGWTCGHGPSWAAGTRAIPFKFFLKSAQTEGLPNVKNSSNFAGR
jgi:hypothetical protein